MRMGGLPFGVSRVCLGGRASVLPRTWRASLLAPRRATGESWHPGQSLSLHALAGERAGRAGAGAGLRAVQDERRASSTPSAPPAPPPDSGSGWAAARTHYCGRIHETEEGAGADVTLCGWVHRSRNLGGLLFLDIRDCSGLAQVVVSPENQPDAHRVAERLRGEWVVCVTGRVRARQQPNPKMPTGAVEVDARHVAVLNPVTKRLALEVNSDGAPPREELRLSHRVLDLRRPQMLSNMRLRHEVTKAFRGFLEDRGFLEVETPMLSRSTPEGARDFLVPSRVTPQAMYALPQSPQLFKQMLMVAGLDRYYQIARCFRDEDLRADRQPEFTQVDLEVSFMAEPEITSMMEQLTCHVFEQAAGVSLSPPFDRMTYQEAMTRYGTDKPDTRYALCHHDVTCAVGGSQCKIFSSAVQAGGIVKAMVVPPEGASAVSNSRLKPGGDVSDRAAAGGAKGLLFLRVKAQGKVEGSAPVTKSLTEAEVAQLLAETGAQEGELVLLIAGPAEAAHKAMDNVRQHLAHALGLVDDSAHRLLWVTDFPMFEWVEDQGRYQALHHPFTAPKLPSMGEGATREALFAANAHAYDLVYNGHEIGGGSLRNHSAAVQQEVFRAIGLSDEEVGSQFGYLIESLQSGAPPHGGMAFGLDRLVMLLAGEASLRDVIAFPKTTQGSCALTHAPSQVRQEQLRDLGLRHTGEAGQGQGQGGEAGHTAATKTE